ncbi:MAG: N-6 DNA methylase [Kiritimatiellia bacterium]
MLDAQTKTRIDSARDILVGKVPDPKSQVEQITIALIYKFMDDMDRQSEELGGKVTFFAGEFKKYRWAQLLDKRYGGHERLLLYAEGIEKMNVNKNIPQLFRDIFKGVFLPYRDPETLNLFLKEIDSFSYDHSERLGDAFEYLLSVLGTQGDAGQFRTPRHIIDFIVAVVDPNKTETILDPACGTAGFLISAYKHIVKTNESLTPDERARLMTNFRGYDIAPDMVRLARANLYLHGFPNPVLHEYDTLTSEERWDERCDVILANPPFMTPKGGIRPHNRFSIQAKRSEVLFVDYIAEHLNPGGRAGVIVPEGIIFQSQNAYKQLRKMLVENNLWAVVSLPAGVFNPYSGVKTSILFLDRNLARQRDEVLFVKVENDGFDLGAQRRLVEGNDMPAALAALNEFKSAVSANRQSPIDNRQCLSVPRARLLESPDISLSGDRYRVAAARHVGKWPMVKLGEVCNLEKGTSFTRAQAKPGSIPVVAGGQNPSCYHAEANRKPPVITVSASGAYAGFVNFFEVPIFATDCTTIVSTDEQQVTTRFVFEILKGKQDKVYDAQKGMAQPHVYARDLIALELPLPPLDEQERIVAELEGYRKVIEGARQIIASYKPTIRIDPKWPVVKLGDLAAFRNGLNYSKDSKGTGLKVIGVSVFQDRLIAPIADLEEVNPDGIADSDDMLADGDLVFVRSNGNKDLVGRCLLVETGGEHVSHSAFTIRLRFKTRDTLPLFYAILFRGGSFRQQLTGRGANISNLSQDILRDMEIPLPPLAIQRQIVTELEAERKLVEANRELIARMEAKIKAKLAEVWGGED